MSEEKKSVKEVEDAIMEAAKAGRVIFAPSDRIYEYANEISEFVGMVFHVKSFFVSDESSCDDFSTNQPLWRNLTKEIFDIDLPEGNVLIVDAAKAIRLHRMN